MCLSFIERIFPLLYRFYGREREGGREERHTFQAAADGEVIAVTTLS